MGWAQDYWARAFDPRHQDNVWTVDGYRIEVIRHDISSRFQTRFLVTVRGWGKRVEAEVFVIDEDRVQAHHKVGEAVLAAVEKIEEMVKRVDNTQAVIDKLTEMARAVIA